VSLDELRTERLVLRALGPTDEPALVALWNDSAVGRFLWDGRRERGVNPTSVRGVARGRRT
jgi:hypothetical protein